MIDYTVMAFDDYTKWVEIYIIWPRKTIKGKWLYFQKAYTRKVWIVYDNCMHMEPIQEYATLFDVLRYAK